MNKNTIIEKALNSEFLSLQEGLYLYQNLDLIELMFIANQIRLKKHTHKKVTWIIDRNVNITNVCSSGCKFCNFFKGENSKEAFITTINQYKQKINELFELGGEQLLLQGGLHPKLDIKYYCNLFTNLKSLFPNIKLHALGPPEVAYIASISNISIKETLQKLKQAGLDSLPGAGAEILVDKVRETISPNKCNADTWVEVMRQAHQLGFITSATMMFGHADTIENRIEHIIKIRDLQNEKPNKQPGFLAFIPWPFHYKGTLLEKRGIYQDITAEEYIKTIAISRIMLPNIDNIQASWLTVGKETAQICLHAGANDFGSIMIEENVVSSAGASYKFDSEGMQKAILEAGFTPQLRNQKYEFLNFA